MSNDNPFFLSKVECPICKTINEFETVRVGAYKERGRETDFGPSGIEWKNPRYQAYNPLVFFTATCSNCYYTREFTNKFKDWKSDTTFKTYRLKTVKERHLERLAAADSVIRRLGSSIDLHNFPNESAILKLHLAVLDETFHEHCSRLDLGRFYVRIGWVFRHLNTGENPNITFLTGLLLELDKNFEVVKNSLANFKENTAGFHRYVTGHFDTEEISSDLKSQVLPYRDRFQSAMGTLGDSVFRCEKDMGDISNLVSEYKTLASGEDGGGLTSFGSHASFAEFLIDLKKSWDGIVVNEREALQKAAHYYKEAFTNGRDIAPGNQQIQAAYLIAELSRRIGDYDSAKQYFNSTIKLGQEFIYENRRDQSRTALARKILELAIEQGRSNLAAMKSA